MMMELMDTLYSTKDSSLGQFDDMRHQLELTTKEEEINIIAGNHEIIEVIEGLKMTKKVRKSTKKRNDIENWINATKLRYSRYREFVEVSERDHPEICHNIVLINRFFYEKTLSLTNITKLVYKTDKMLINKFKIWNLVE